MSEEEIFEILSHFHGGDDKTEQIENAIKEFIDLYNKEKQETVKQYELGLAQGAYEKDLVWKEKIKEKIKYHTMINDEVAVVILEKLLEEE